MGNSGTIGGGMAKQSLWAMRQQQCNGWHNGQRTIATNAEAVQCEATQDGWQQQNCDGWQQSDRDGRRHR